MRRVSVDSALLVLFAVAAFALMFFPWAEHEGLHGPDAARYRDDSTLVLALNGWELSAAVGLFVLVASSLALATAIRNERARAESARRLPLAMATALAGWAAAVRIGVEIASPSDSIYNYVLAWPYVALCSCIGLGATASVSARRRRERLVRPADGARGLGLTGTLVALSGAALAASMFLTWYGSEHPVPDPKRFTAWNSLQLGRGVLVVAALTGFAPLAQAALAPESRLRRLPYVAAAVGGVLAAVVAWRAIESPPHQAYFGVFYQEPTTGPYVALIASLAMVVAAAAGLVERGATRAEIGAELREAGRRLGLIRVPRTEKPAAEVGRADELSRKPSYWPIVAGAVVVLAIAVGAGPLYAVGLLVPLAVGYAIPRWWLLAVPIPLALLAGSLLPDPCEGGDSDCEATGLRWIVLLGAAVIATVGLALGIAMRKLYRRASTPSYHR